MSNRDTHVNELCKELVREYGKQVLLVKYCFEPPRLSRRLQPMRGWSNEYIKEILIRDAGRERFGWCESISMSMPRNGLPLHRSRIKIGCTAETPRRWMRQAERDAGERPGLTTEERERLKQLEQENRELRQANEILRKASAYFS